MSVFHNEEGDLEFRPAALHVVGKVGLRQTIFGDDFRFLQSAVVSALPKLTIPSPSMVHYRGGRAAIDEDVYPDLDAFWADLSPPTVRSRRLDELGCTTCSWTTRASRTSTIRSNGARRVDRRRPRPPARRYIRHINEALADRPAG